MFKTETKELKEFKAKVKKDFEDNNIKLQFGLTYMQYLNKRSHEDFGVQNFEELKKHFDKINKEIEILKKLQKQQIKTKQIKDNKSTMIYDRYDEWTRDMTYVDMMWHWYLGEQINSNNSMWLDYFSESSIAFIGTSGSGKTEAMKTWLTAMLIKQPETRLVFIDLKGASDWDVFRDYTEERKIITPVPEALNAILSIDVLFKEREMYMAKKGYNNIKDWGDKEGITVPPVLLIIDEFPQITEALNFDNNKNKEGTPANLLFKIATKGSSFGFWFGLGTQFGGSEYISEELMKNIKYRVVLRCSESESIKWLGSPVASKLGKKLNPDGTINGETGYAFVNSANYPVRFWYLHNYFIQHELLKYKVPRMIGTEILNEYFFGLNKNITDKLKNYAIIDMVSKNFKKLKRTNEHSSLELIKNNLKKEAIQKIDNLTKEEKQEFLLNYENKLNRYDNYLLDNYKKGLALFKETYNKVVEEYEKDNIEGKKPILLFWKKDESD